MSEIKKCSHGRNFCLECHAEKHDQKTAELHPLIKYLNENGELIALKATIAQQAQMIEWLKGGHGEPVAWTYKRKDQSEFGAPTTHIDFATASLDEMRQGKTCEGRQILVSRDDMYDWKPLFYTSQPAPVSVTHELSDLLFKCRNRINWGGDPIVEQIDICLDKIKRLYAPQ